MVESTELDPSKDKVHSFCLSIHPLPRCTSGPQGLVPPNTLETPVCLGFTHKCRVGTRSLDVWTRSQRRTHFTLTVRDPSLPWYDETAGVTVSADLDHVVHGRPSFRSPLDRNMEVPNDDRPERESTTMGPETYL